MLIELYVYKKDVYERFLREMVYVGALFVAYNVLARSRDRSQYLRLRFFLL
jgi:hypothetical protein